MSNTIDNQKDKTFYSESEDKAIQQMEDFIFLCTRIFERQFAEIRRQAQWQRIVQYEKNFKKREGLLP